MIHFKKIFLALIVSLISSLGIAYGDYGCPSSCEVVCQPDNCGCGKLFIGAELLYFRAYEGGLSNVCDATQIIDSTEDGLVVSRLNGRNHDPDYKWNPGFRIGAGYEFSDSKCGVGVTWTHFNSHSGKGVRHNDDNSSSFSSSTGNSSSESGSIIRSFSSDSSCSEDSRRNRHSWKVDFDAVDILFGCSCNCSGCFDVTPYIGLKYARIDQTLSTNFFRTQNELFTTSNGNFKQDFWGIGPLFGVEGEWGLGCGFSVYGNLSVAFLYGTHHVNSLHTEAFDTGRNIDRFKRHTQACQSVVDAGLGVRWKTCICDDMFLVVQLGLEEHRYFNYNQFCGYGDLSLDGVSFGLGLIY